MGTKKKNVLLGALIQQRRIDKGMTQEEFRYPALKAGRASPSMRNCKNCCRLSAWRTTCSVACGIRSR